MLSPWPEPRSLAEGDGPRLQCEGVATDVLFGGQVADTLEGCDDLYQGAQAVLQHYRVVHLAKDYELHLCTLCGHPLSRDILFGFLGLHNSCSISQSAGGTCQKHKISQQRGCHTVHSLLM